MDFLMNMRWDAEGYSGSNNRYFVNIPAYVGEVEMDLNIDNNASKLYFTGRLIDESFRIEGDVRSTRGRGPRQCAAAMRTSSIFGIGGSPSSISAIMNPKA